MSVQYAICNVIVMCVNVTQTWGVGVINKIQTETITDETLSAIFQTLYLTWGGGAAHALINY